MPPWQAVEAAISRETGRRFRAVVRRALAGGCINRAYELADDDGRWFVKLNDAARIAMFEAEVDALAALAATRTLRVPEPLCCGCAEGSAWLVLAWIAPGEPAPGAWAALGSGLAALHRTVAERHGFHRDNTIGETSQPNRPCADWTAFWRERRLGHQLRLAAGRGLEGRTLKAGERLLGRLDALFAGHRPAPSLLHGDLWSGNVGFDAGGAPFVFDPASYHGDRETDLAMTALFGGFDPAFHAAYREAWPLPPGHARRRDLYNLYHVLNHYNLFGGSYASRARDLIERLLAAA